MYSQSKEGVDITGRLLERWEKEGTDIEGGDKVVETAWKRRRGWSRIQILGEG